LRREKEMIGHRVHFFEFTIFEDVCASERQRIEFIFAREIEKRQN
jgi:hypothetical protein